MKQRFRTMLFIVLTLSALLLLSGCGENLTPYENNNQDGYTVSVKYDANGGTFTTNTSVIVDSFDVDNKLAVALISPDDSRREHDAFTATKNGYFLAGWYKECTESTDSNGEVIYSYSGKWDFENDLLKIDSTKEYSADTPALTLYAAWVPLFEIEFYSLNSGELVDTLQFDPTEEKELLIPAWDEETGAIDMHDFPKREGYTYNKAFYDIEGVNELTGETLIHPGVLNEQNATAIDSVLKLYVDWSEGEWYRIYNVDQFKESASLTGNYELFADLDFADEIWPTTYVYGNFTGVIKGNGHVIKNVEITQSNNSKVNAGLFGYLADTSEISDVNFENITFTIKAGTRKVGTSFGLFAGTISDKATITNVNVLNSHLQIDSSAYFAVDDYSIGLVCGMGDSSKLTTAQIGCSAVGDEPETVKINQNGNAITVDFEN